MPFTVHALLAQHLYTYEGVWVSLRRAAPAVLAHLIHIALSSGASRLPVYSDSSRRSKAANRFCTDVMAYPSRWARAGLPEGRFNPRAQPIALLPSAAKCNRAHARERGPLGLTRSHNADRGLSKLDRSPLACNRASANALREIDVRLRFGFA